MEAESGVSVAMRDKLVGREMLHRAAMARYPWYTKLLDREDVHVSGDRVESSREPPIKWVRHSAKRPVIMSMAENMVMVARMNVRSNAGESDVNEFKLRRKYLMLRW